MQADKLVFDTLDERDRRVAITNANRACEEMAHGAKLADLSDDLLMAYVIMRQVDYHLAVAEAGKRGPATVVLQ